jgi:PAS domain S-box-containing protein
LNECEESASIKGVNQAMGAINERIDSLDATAHDWSLWDDTYQFVQDRNEEYIRGNLTTNALEILGVNFMIFVGTGGGIVYQTAVDLAKSEGTAVPASLDELVYENEELWNFADTDGGLRGMLRIPEGLVMLASSPIGTSLGEGPVRGALIIGRYVDSAEIERMSSTTNLDLNIEAPRQSEMLDIPLEGVLCSADERVFMSRLSDTVLQARAPIEDILGNPTLLLTVNIPRDHYMSAKAAVGQAFLVMIVIWVVFTIIIMALLRKQVLSRLSGLISDVGKVGERGDLSARISMDGNDELTALAGEINDMLSSLESSEEALAKSEEHFRNLFETSLAGMWRMSIAEPRFVQANKAMADLLGFGSPDKLIAECNPRELAPQDHGEGFLELLREKGALSGYVAHAVLKDGTEKYLSVSCKAYPDKDYVEGIAIDVTDRKLAEDARARLAAAVEQAVEGIAISDPSGVIQYVNPAFGTITGSPSEEWIGRNILECMENHLGSGVSDIVRAKIMHGESWSGKVVCERKGGALYEGEITVFPVKDESGEIQSLVAHHRDITEVSMLEAQLRQAHKLEAIGKLAAGIAHEISTPTRFVGENTRFVGESFGEIVNVLKKQDQLLEAVSEGSCSPELVESVQRAIDETDINYLTEEIPKALAQSLEGIERVTSLVRAMKDFSHPGTDKKVWIDINRAIESTMTIARNEWKHVADVVTEFDPDVRDVPCFPAEFNQVTLNLITNAAQAIGDIVSAGATEKGLITISTSRDGDWFEMRIADTGGGIPGEIRDRIFGMFFTTKEIGRGTGQGLAISKALVDKHGGTITFESKVGVGTTFIVRLPMTEDEAGVCPASVD